jgi:hypothetical protein
LVFDAIIGFWISSAPRYTVFCNSSDAAVLSPEGFPPGGRGRIGEALDGILYYIILFFIMLYYNIL